MQLSEFAVRKAKSREKAYRLSDGGSLHLLVQTNGSKLWQMRYRFLGKEKLLSFGPYPLVSIADARRKRDDAKRQLLDGTDPSAKKKLDRLDAEAQARQTFGLLADEYLEQQRARGAAPATQTKTTWLLKDLAAPLSDRPIHEITPAELLALLQRIEKSGRRETARRLRGTISSVFKLAIVTLRAKDDPTVPLHWELPIARQAVLMTEERISPLRARMIEDMRITELLGHHADMDTVPCRRLRLEQRQVLGNEPLGHVGELAPWSAVHVEASGLVLGLNEEAQGLAQRAPWFWRTPVARFPLPAACADNLTLVPVMWPLSE